ncbi:hypothetical protein [Microbaculum marinisediminis]|uniref:Asparagine synthetase domain-containing protein n=1 Tax=Microbaculum marinisediminis TaxID=2931392 RepID=A0AAW5QUZ5_9HYPH|nr:hypothetical protein [Microbaculum sp. A6E488]MCT8971047.1 hypothetical protein [Microbaculum sp. A6E488]
MELADQDGQFVIRTNRNMAVPAGATRHLLASVAVDTFGTLETLPVFDRSDQQIGLLIGTVVDTDRKVVLHDGLRLDGSLDGDGDVDAFVETQIYRLAGTFLFVLDHGGTRRVYLDANGTKSLVYDPSSKMAGATATVLLDAREYDRRLRHDLLDALGVHRGGSLPGGLTAHRGIYRLLCNHYLDLDSWTATRHWPKAEIAQTTDVAATCRTIVTEVKNTIEALIKEGDVHVALTAGHDTRLVLACCRDFVDQITFVTLQVPGDGIDIQLAGALSEKFNLRHRVLPFVKTDSDEAERWQKRAGHAVRGPNMDLYAAVAPLKDRIFVGGACGEIGRGCIWFGATDTTPIDARQMASRLKLPMHREVINAIDNWLAPIDHLGSLLKLDLAYMELSIHCWVFVQSYTKPGHVEINPLISRRLFTAMLSLPPEVRLKNGMILRCIESAWPEVASVPINQYGNWRDKTVKLRHAISDPRRAIRKARQLVSILIG